MAKGHHYPTLVFRYPALIRLMYLFNDLLLHRNGVVRRHLNRLAIQFRPRSVGDIGFGEGQHLFRYASRHPEQQAMGIEVDADHLAFAERYLEKAGLKHLNVLSHDLSVSPLPTAVDLLYSVGVLHLIEQDQRLVQNAFDSLTLGGHFLLYQPVNGYSYLPGASFVKQRLHGYDQRQGFSRIYNEPEVVAIFEQAGFRVVWQERHMGPWQVLAHELHTLPTAVVLYADSWGVKGLALLLSFVVMPIALVLRLVAPGKATGKANALCVLFEKV